MLKVCAASLVLSGFLFWGCSDSGVLVAGYEGIQDEQEGEDTVILSLKKIELSQGEKGVELWRLKAAAASMKGENRNIIVEKPLVTYFLPPPDADTLLVTSVSGDVDQTNQILRFLQDVRVTQKSAEVRGDLLLYNGTAKMMTLPQGGSFTDVGMSGKASLVRWRMEDKLIEAEGDVKVVFTARQGTRASAPGGAAESSLDGAR